MDKIIDLAKFYGEGIGIPEKFMNEATFIILLVVTLFGLIASIHKLYRFITLHLKQRRLNKDLAPYFSKAEIIEATKYYLPTKYQNISPAEDEEPGKRYIASAKNLIIPMFLKKAFKNNSDDNKYYLILADSGMGKTTFLINLFIAYQNQWRKPYKIRLFPLGSRDTLKDIADIDKEEQKNTILLLDAFDEDNEAVKDYKKRMEEIIHIVWRFREVVITCRTQFFPSQSEEPHETGYFKFSGNGGEHDFQKLYLSVFDNKDINKYLLKRFNLVNPINWKKYRQAQSIAKKCPNLMIRPMLLSNIDALTTEAQNYQYTYQIYSKLITVWINREAKKPGIKDRYQTSDNFKQLLENFSQNLAVDLYQQRNKRGGLLVKIDEKLNLPGELQISDLEIINQGLSEKEKQNRSLLNRNADGYYKFSHKLILEYFLAKKLNEDIGFYRDFNFDGMDDAKYFYTEIFYDNHLQMELKNTEGTFTTPSNNKVRTISSMTYDESRAVDMINVESADFKFIKLIGRFINIETVKINSLAVMCDQTVKRILKEALIIIRDEIKTISPSYEKWIGGKHEIDTTILLSDEDEVREQSAIHNRIKNDALKIIREAERGWRRDSTEDIYKQCIALKIDIEYSRLVFELSKTIRLTKPDCKIYF